MEILKTDLSRFKHLTDFPYREHFVDFEGMQMHYIDEGSGETILALHGEPTWSYLYRKFIPGLKNYRFVAPDLIGFGKSDKIVGHEHYDFELHFRSLENFIDRLDLQNITLVVQDWGGLLGLSLLGAHPDRFARVVIMNTFLPKGNKLPLPFRIWQLFSLYHPNLPVGGIVQFASATKIPKEVIAAYNLPFPTAKHKAGARAFPQLVPSRPTQGGVDRMNTAREVLRNWDKPALVLFSDKDRVFSGLEKYFYKLIPTTADQPRITIEGAGHFLQEEKGEEIAAHIERFMINSPIT
ncbi:alpha/beta fold hydrolase [Cryomorphaceae bacterium]|nr:alpha/beta fold hydrolase [Cryomorphaceae bacterium]